MMIFLGIEYSGTISRDFKGLYIASDTCPLSWDFENIPGNPDMKMEDPDSDGIFEKELTFNVFDPSLTGLA